MVTIIYVLHFKTSEMKFVFEWKHARCDLLNTRSGRCSRQQRGAKTNRTGKKKMNAQYPLKESSLALGKEM